MSWEAIGAIGDIGGAVAVIATLFFLYKQIRLNTRELERANLHQSAQSTMSNNALYVQIWQTVDAGQRASRYLPKSHQWRDII